MPAVRSLRIITFKLDVDTLMKLDKLAVAERRYRSEIIREAIEAYLSSKVADKPSVY
ncbi:CopG family ribbon-helix-helix protein [Acidilobus sp.]|jgi:predicted transcriptional regulator|uniref:CopG family ribbon-helix-helix protein n=1 Tax=Acidilobus sp. TaxID=1872109 RepID=UPI003D038770